MVKGMDRRVLMGIVPGLAGLALGTAGFVAASPVLALLAGACALISAAAAVSAVGALRGRDDEATELRERIVELEVAIDAGREALEVTGRFAEMMATREIEATENQPAPVVDRESGLLDERYFEVTLDSRVATARRHLPSRGYPPAAVAPPAPRSPAPGSRDRVDSPPVSRGRARPARVGRSDC